MYDNKLNFDPDPRNKLFTHGISRLTDQELIALLIRTGTEKCNLEQLSRRVLEELEAEQYTLNLSRIEKLPGMGQAKSSSLAAAFELSRRFYLPGRQRIRTPADVLPVVHHFADRRQEHFLTITLDGAHDVINCHIVTVGLVNKTMIHPREVFTEAIADRAVSVIVAHNHPSGILEPSPEDRYASIQLKKSGEILGIPVLDHIIFTTAGYYSFLEAGEWEPIA